MLYLLNSPVLTGYGDWRFRGPLSVEEARSLLSGVFTSAIGHEAAARFLSASLGIEIPANRIHVTLEAGDSALVLWVKQRLPENKMLTPEETAAIGYELGLLSPLRTVVRDY